MARESRTRDGDALGLAAAGAVVVAVLIALTLVPALLGFWPNAVLSRWARRSGWVEESGAANAGTRWARFVLRRPLPVLLLGVVGLGALALPAADLQLGMPGDAAKPVSTSSAGPTTRLPRVSDRASTGR
jgi:RND superfamily putative drug exporter